MKHNAIKRTNGMAAAHGRDFTTINAHAGSGKSTVLQQIRAELEKDGYVVIGAALTGKAAACLQASSGIESAPLALLAKELRRGALELDSQVALVLDDGCMLKRRAVNLAYAVVAAGGRLIVVCDDRQILVEQLQVEQV